MLQKSMFLLPLISLLWGCSGPYDTTRSLAGGATETITLKADKPLKVGWELIDKQAGNTCPGQKCVMLERKDDFGYIGGQFGAAMAFTPKDGKMVFELKNLAPTALKIRVYAEQP